MVVHGSRRRGVLPSIGSLALGAAVSRAPEHARAGGGGALCAAPTTGPDGDLVAVLRALAEITPRLALAGFSLGANVGALAMGRSAARLPPGLFGAAAVSPPLDLSACADALDSPRNRLYCGNYLVQLREDYRRRQRARPDLYEAGRERGTRTIREYDDRITAYYGGYQGAADYYARSSAGQLVSVERPLLILAAATTRCSGRV